MTTETTITTITPKFAQTPIYKMIELTGVVSQDLLIINPNDIVTILPKKSMSMIGTTITNTSTLTFLSGSPILNVIESPNEIKLILDNNEINNNKSNFVTLTNTLHNEQRLINLDRVADIRSIMQHGNGGSRLYFDTIDSDGDIIALDVHETLNEIAALINPINSPN